MLKNILTIYEGSVTHRILKYADYGSEKYYLNF